MKTFIGRVAVITGGAGGIGRAVAERFAAEGMKIVLSDIDEAALQDTVSEMRGDGADVAGVAADVSRPDDVERLAAQAVSLHGGVNVICNNAGVDSGAPFSDIPLGTWNWVFGVNFWGALHGCRAFLPLLRKEEEGHIINVASNAAISGYHPTSTPYVASKFAVLGLSESLYHELADANESIGVSVLCPSFVRTRLPFAERNRPAYAPSLDDHPGRRQHVEHAKSQVQTGLDPGLVADQVLAAVRDRQFYILPHREKSIAAMRARQHWMETGKRPFQQPA